MKRKLSFIIYSYDPYPILILDELLFGHTFIPFRKIVDLLNYIIRDDLYSALQTYLEIRENIPVSPTPNLESLLRNREKISFSNLKNVVEDILSLAHSIAEYLRKVRPLALVVQEEMSLKETVNQIVQESGLKRINYFIIDSSVYFQYLEILRQSIDIFISYPSKFLSSFSYLEKKDIFENVVFTIDLVWLSKKFPEFLLSNPFPDLETLKEELKIWIKGLKNINKCIKEFIALIEKSDELREKLLKMPSDLALVVSILTIKNLYDLNSFLGIKYKKYFVVIEEGYRNISRKFLEQVGMGEYLESNRK